MAVFYPQVRATLQMVFDGFGKGISRETWSDLSPAFRKRFPGLRPEANPFVLNVLPLSAEVHLNSYKEADTWSLEFNARDLPISPELVRAIGVQIYVFQTDGLDAHPDYARDENLVLTGLADNASVTYQSDGKVFRLDGRDYTALMLDKPWMTSKPVPHGPLDAVVKQIVDEATNAALHGTTLSVVFDAAEDVPFVGDSDKLLTRKKVTVPSTTRKTHSKTKKKGFAVRMGKSYWDVIYELCLRHGFIAFVERNTVRISTPKSLVEDSKARVFKVAYGRNLELLSVERKIGKETVPQIQVASYDSTRGESIVAKWPEKPVDKVTGIGTKKEEVRLYTVAGVRDPETLKRVARLMYESIARGESKTHWATKHLRELTHKDLCTLRVGDAVEVAWDAFNAEELRQIRDRQTREERLLALGYSPQVAAFVAEHVEKIHQFERPMYVKGASFLWRNEDGLSVEAETINFVDVGRDDARQ